MLIYLQEKKNWKILARNAKSFILERQQKAQETSQKAAHLTKLIKTWEDIKDCDELLEILPDISRKRSNRR